MRTIKLCSVLLGFAGFVAASLTNSFGAESAPTPYARISSVRLEGTNVVVEVEASADFTKVTLESTTRANRRAWQPRAVKVIENASATVHVAFTLPTSPELEILRVRGDRITDSLPAELYTGTNKFAVAGTAGANGPVNFNDGGPTAGPGAGDDREDSSPQRSVVESDIWKLVGDTLFFFNQYRGMQVIDVSSPDSPEVTGTYDLPGAGEQMYVINGTNVVLLARDNCAWYGTESQSRVILLQVRDGEPHLVKELPVAGQIVESRLVGSALYVVASSYQRRVSDGGPSGGASSETWDWGNDIVSFDLADFATAEQKSSDWVRGYGNVIMATDKYLFVSQQVYDSTSTMYSSTINSYDISSPNGTFTKLATFNAGGNVKDKFKMNVIGNTFVVVVQRENWQRGERTTNVRTYSFANPSAPQFLADLKIIENEQLFATRFDGDRLYAVTFRVIDPLWIIDLSNPAAPKKLGELEIPGWSTFLQPMGDRLLAIGIDQSSNTWRTAVQLFNVADPANPTLLSKVLIGEQWSGSEANWDEKAFGVLPDENLVLVPFYSSGAAGYQQGVQLIDLFENTLVKRGIVEHNMAARRATIHRDRMLSLSSRELLTVDVTDRDKPAVIETTTLSWAAEHVHLVGNHLIEVDSYNNSGPALRVVHTDDPSEILSSLVLTNIPYLGSVEMNNHLYLLQGRGAQYIYPADYNPTNYYPIATNPGVYILTELALDVLPNLTVAHRIVKESKEEFFWGQYDGLRVSDDILVWASESGGGYPWLDWGGPMAAVDGRADAAIGAPVDSLWRGPWWGGSSGHFVAVDLSGDVPAFASEVKLTGTNYWWSFSEATTENGLVFTSHQSSEYDPTIDPPPYTYQQWNGKEYVVVTNDPPPGAWVQRHYLDVIDFTEPAEPLVRAPVNIPGTLLGAHRGGELLYTRGYDGNPFSYNGEEKLSAVSYDGIAAHLIHSITLNGQSWPRPAISDEGFVYLGVAAAGTNTNSTLQVWTLGSSGKLEQVENVTLSTPAQALKKLDDLLAVQSARIDLYDASVPTDLVPVGSGLVSGCFGVVLDGADGSLVDGLWLPIGWYGVVHIPAGVAP
ncbi:MAG TPA: beta-propeller domain-containing protein [Verrucomicrobiae bacterium]